MRTGLKSSTKSRCRITLANFPQATLVVYREVFMVKLRNIFVLIFAVQIAAFAAADPALLRLVMPDAKVVAGLQVTQARNSLFGQFVLSHMQVEDETFKKFMAQT